MSGIYLHIPFCAKKCSYCDFHFSTTFEAYRNEMIACLVEEINLRAPLWSDCKLDTIYFGGGTPSLLKPQELKHLFDAIVAHFDVSNISEITLEANPDDCSEENIRAWKQMGVNRLSIGIQSTTPTQLTWMNRTHNAEEGMQAVKRAIALGIDQISVDLIYGLPDLSVADWEAQLREITALPIQHISAYCLTIEERTPLAAWVKKGVIHPVDADMQSLHFECMVAVLNTAGFEQYEISNFARKEAYAKHNSSYWLGKKYLAIGPSAHGFDGKDRYWNVANNQQYMRALMNKQLDQEVEVLSNFDRFNERVMVGLRTKWGVKLHELLELCSPGPDWYEQVESFKTSGKLAEDNGALVLTESGRLLADAIAAELFLLPD